MAIIYIVRHGKTDFNEQGRYLGITNLSLNTAGRQQAKELAKEIKKLKVDLIVSSPLKRALETAEIIKPDAHTITINPHFIERSVGVYEGLTKKEAKEKFPDLYKKILLEFLIMLLQMAKLFKMYKIEVLMVWIKLKKIIKIKIFLLLHMHLSLKL